MLNNCTFNDKTKIFTTFLIIFRMMKWRRWKIKKWRKKKQSLNWEKSYFLCLKVNKWDYEHAKPIETIKHNWDEKRIENPIFIAFLMCCRRLMVWVQLIFCRRIYCNMNTSHTKFNLSQVFKRPYKEFNKQ